MSEPRLIVIYLIILQAILSFCLLHTCCCVYSAGSSLGKLSENEKELLILGTLRAFEFSRFRSMTGNQDVVINEERRALLTLEGRLMEQYRQQASKLLGAGKLTLREHMYMKLLCKCNRDGDCFFNDAHPLGLAHFLVKNTLQTSTPEGEELVLCLCLYTLCHSYSPGRLACKSSG